MRKILSRSFDLAQFALNQALDALVHEARNGCNKEKLRANAELAAKANEVLSAPIKASRSPSAPPPILPAAAEPKGSKNANQRKKPASEQNLKTLLDYVQKNGKAKHHDLTDKFSWFDSRAALLMLEQKGILRNEIGEKGAKFWYLAVTKPVQVKKPAKKPPVAQPQQAKPKRVVTAPYVYTKARKEAVERTMTERKKKFEAALKPVYESLLARFNMGEEIPNKTVEGKRLISPAIQRLEAEGVIESYRKPHGPGGIGQPPKMWRLKKQ